MTSLNLKHDFSKLVFETLNLDEELCNQLISPQKICMQDPCFEDCAEFLKKSEKLLVCGDYDADGICATSIALLLCKRMGLQAAHYIPNRLSEGYGLSTKTVQMAYEKGYKELLLVDNGVKAHDALALASELGLRVCVIDHHIMEDEVQCEALLHPDLLGPYGQTMCAGGLVYALCEYMGLADDTMLALACIATVGDVMPLWHKNREIVIEGLKVLNASEFLQIDCLVKRTRFTKYTASLLSFQLIPKINSMGRLADKVNVNSCVFYFLSENPEQIKKFAQEMIELNDLRKKMGQTMSQKALSMVDEEPFQILVDESFHEGLLGIVANQLLSVTGKPSLVLTSNGSLLKGSARSSSISLAALFQSLNSDYFEAMGGHDFAFGMSIKTHYFNDFKNDVMKYMRENHHSVSGDVVLSVSSDIMTQEAMVELSQFEPFGEGFKIPKVSFNMPKEFTISAINSYGYKYNFMNTGLDEAVFFNTAVTMETLKNASLLSGEVSYNTFGKVSVNIDSIV